MLCILHVTNYRSNVEIASNSTCCIGLDKNFSTVSGTTTTYYLQASFGRTDTKAVKYRVFIVNSPITSYKAIYAPRFHVIRTQQKQK